MKKQVLFLSILLIIFLSLSFTSAFVFPDWLSRITGRITGQAISDQGLVAHFQFENNFVDSVGGVVGSCSLGVSCPRFDVGKFGQAAKFDGVNDLINIGSVGEPQS